MLKIENLNKSFGEKQVLFDINLTAKDGHIVGLIGKNGSGKTTLFHSILKFVKYQGQILIDGKPFDSNDYNQVGYLPEERSLMPKETVFQQVAFLASLKGMKKSEIKEKLVDWMNTLQVKGAPYDKIKTLSKGNHQKVQLIATLIHQPNFIILDEPFSGLDPVNVDLMKKMILEQKKRGATIIFSDHDMRNVEELCDDVVMINDGHVVLEGSVNEIRESYGLTRLYIRTERSEEEILNLEGVKSVTRFNDGRYRLILEDAKYGRKLFEQLSEGQYLRTFDQEPPTLNEIFKLKVDEENE